MTDADAVVLSARLTLLAEVLDAPMSPARLAGYRAFLDDLAITDIVAALNALGRTCVFFPKPAEVRAQVQVARHLRQERERALWLRMRDTEADATLEAHQQAHDQALLEAPHPPVPFDERLSTQKAIIAKLKALAGPPTPRLPTEASHDDRVRQQIAEWRKGPAA